MRLAVVLLLLLAPAVVAAQSSHEKTRSSARKKSSASRSSSSSSGSDSGWGGCLASLCEVGAEVASSSQDEPEEPEAAGPGYLPPTGYDVAPLVVVEEPVAAVGSPVAAEARTGAAPGGGVIDARVGGAYLFAPLPNAAAELRALLEAGSGPGLELWYTSLLEKQHSGWDQLPLGGARFSLRLGDEELALRLHLGAALLALGPGELLPALDPGAALEAQLGGDGAPWLDLSTSLLVFRGFVAPDVSAGLSFRFDPVYVRGGYGFRWLEGAYTGPSVALGVHL